MIGRMKQKPGKGDSMLNKVELNNQTEQLSDIIESLTTLAVTIREAFVHQQKRSLDDIGNQHLLLNEEIAFVAAMADEQMIGRPLVDKEAIIHYEHILIHLQMTTKLFKELADVLRKQMKDGVLIFDKEAGQTLMLLKRQEIILRTLDEIVQDRDSVRLKEVSNECHELVCTCDNFAASYESRLADGQCIPESAPVMLSTFNRVKSLVHNEVETVRLLDRWFSDCASDSPVRNRVGLTSH